MAGFLVGWVVRGGEPKVLFRGSKDKSSGGKSRVKLKGPKLSEPAGAPRNKGELEARISKKHAYKEEQRRISVGNIACFLRSF